MSYNLSRMVFAKLAMMPPTDLLNQNPQQDLNQNTALAKTPEAVTGEGDKTIPGNGTPPEASPLVNEYKYPLGNVGTMNGSATTDNNALLAPNPLTMPGSTNTFNSINAGGSLLSGGGLQPPAATQKEQNTAVPNQVAQLGTPVPKPDLNTKVSSLNLLLPLLALGGSGLYLNKKVRDARARAKKNVVKHIPATIIAALAAGTLGEYGNAVPQRTPSRGELLQEEMMRGLPLAKQSSLSLAALAAVLGIPATAYLAGKRVDNVADMRATRITDRMIPAGVKAGLLARRAASTIADLRRAYS